MSDSSSITESLISKRKAEADKKGGTSIGSVKAVDLISRCSIGNQSIMEYEEAEKREITTERSSQASRALITMKRSRDEGAHKLKVYNVQDNFVINRCLLRIGLDVSCDRSDQECRLEHIPVEEANKSHDLPIIPPSSISHARQRKKLKTKKPEVDTGYPDLTLSPSKVSEVLKRLTRTLPFQVSISIIPHPYFYIGKIRTDTTSVLTNFFSHLTESKSETYVCCFRWQRQQCISS